MRTFFPKAMRQKDVEFAVIETTKSLGMNGPNTLFSHSVCPDEINHEAGDITQTLKTHFGEIFGLGGLAGIPFTGATGFAAYAAHVPEGGNIFVLFAPHTTITKEGKLGYYKRFGQSKESTACGAAIGAWEAVKDLEDEPKIDPKGIDYQMEFIKTLIWGHRDRIKASKHPIAEIT